VPTESLAATKFRAAASVTDARVRVLHLHSGNMYGGVETFLVTLANLRRLCPKMEADFGLCFEGRLSSELLAAGVTVHMLGRVRISQPWTTWRARRRVRELIRRERYDAVICHQHWPLVVFGPLIKSVGKKVIFWAHNYHLGENWLERMAQRVRPDLAISDSSFVAHSMSDIYPGVAGRVIYYPVALVDAPDAPSWRAAVRAEQGIPGDTAVIIQVSRFEPWKGQLLHLRALAQLRSRNWVCWMVGGPQNAWNQRHYDEVRKAAKEMGIADRVRFLGQRADVPQLLAAADIFCQPNEGPEPFGIVFVEALWAGRPVVTTAMGGPLEIVTDSCGLLVPPNDPSTLAEQLERLIQSPELRSRLGAAGPARARELCDPAAQMEGLHRLIRQTIEGRLS